MLESGDRQKPFGVTTSVTLCIYVMAGFGLIPNQLLCLSRHCVGTFMKSGTLVDMLIIDYDH